MKSGSETVWYKGKMRMKLIVETSSRSVKDVLGER